jgi:hypothetical protein
VESTDLSVVHFEHPFLLPSQVTGGSVENRIPCGRCPASTGEWFSALTTSTTWWASLRTDAEPACGGAR